MIKMTSIFGFLTAIAVFTLAFTNPNNTQSYVVDVTSSEVNWEGYKVTGKHWGTVQLKSGELIYTNGMLSGGNFVVDMTTIVSDDLEGGTKDRLEGHLKSDDFFGVETYPTARFEITEVISRGLPGDYRVTGNLTIKESTHPMRFNVKLDEKDGKVQGGVELKIDRSDYNVRFGSGRFFDNLGDNTIYDEFLMNVNIVAKKL